MGFACAQPILRAASKRDRAGDAGRDVAADPDRVSLLRYMDAAGTAEHRALSGDIAWRRKARPDQPLRQTGIEAARHRILAAATHEGADLELRVAAIARGIPGRHDAERLVAQHGAIVLEREQFAARTKHHRDPAGPIVHPLRRVDLVVADADGARDLRLQFNRDLARPPQLRCRERKPRAVALDPHQARAAFLDHLAPLLAPLGLAAEREPDMA